MITQLLIISQPHEDGPSYYPTVATISLGSHTVFHYYRYLPSNETLEGATTLDGGEDSSRGRTIDPVPIASVLLEPRSVIITMGDLYQKCLHGIDGVAIDRFVQHEGSADSSTTTVSSGAGQTLHSIGVRVANYDLISDTTTKGILVNGGDLVRSTRVSLTCRVVEKTVMLGGRGTGTLFPPSRAKRD